MTRMDEEGQASSGSDVRELPISLRSTIISILALAGMAVGSVFLVLVGEGWSDKLAGVVGVSLFSALALVQASNARRQRAVRLDRDGISLAGTNGFSIQWDEIKDVYTRKLGLIGSRQLVITPLHPSELLRSNTSLFAKLNFLLDSSVGQQGLVIPQTGLPLPVERLAEEIERRMRPGSSAPDHSA